MTHYKFSLEGGSKKGYCPDPQCRKKTFTRYIKTDTGEQLPEQYGRCDRSESCGYHLNPYRDGYATDQDRSLKAFTTSAIDHKKKTRTAEPALIPNVVLEATIKNGVFFSYFCQNLLTRVPFPFTPDDVEKVVTLYHLGAVAHGYRAGGLTIPFIDENGGCRFIQVKTFDENNLTTGTDSIASIIERHHKKNGSPLPAWLEAYQKNELRVSCLFGAHLLHKYPSNRIALVEAPKTAIYGTLYFGIPKGPDDLLWLAVYSRDTLTVEKCKAIQGRTVYLFPDLSVTGSTYKLWELKAQEIMKALPGTRIVVSDLLEKIAGSEDRVKGLDLADYLIRNDWRLFRKDKTQKVQAQTIPAPEVVTHAEPSPIEKPYIPKQNFNPGSWDKEIEQIDKFFEGVEYLDGPIKLNGVHPVTDIKGFLQMNLETARAQSGNPTFLPYLQRVKDLMKHLDSVKNNPPIYN